MILFYVVFYIEMFEFLSLIIFVSFMLLYMHLRPISDSCHIEIAKGVKSIKTFTVTTPIKVK